MALLGRIGPDITRGRTVVGNSRRQAKSVPSRWLTGRIVGGIQPEALQKLFVLADLSI